MARNELAVFTTLILVENEKGQLLVEDRNDPDWPGICFPGGHVEKGESFTQSAIRETFEETGLTIKDPRLVGVKQFQTKRDERYVVFFYKATQFTGTPHSSDEGEVFWIPRTDLHKYTLCDDFPDMVRVFEEDNLSEFYYYTENGDWKLKLL